MSTLVFYSKSAHKKAGHGSGESIEKNDEFTELDKILDWRRILSNFHYDPFLWNSTEWYCIEEAFQAEKFGSKNYEEFKKCTRKNCKNFKTDIGICSQKMRKWKILDDAQLKEWDKKKNFVMKSISMEKYKQSEIGRKILLLTNNAKLMHFVPRKTYKMHFKHLEEIRNYLENYEAFLDEREELEYRKENNIYIDDGQEKEDYELFEDEM
jgi:predicted NAD-dependent protein-ADP-ribosyltransferase YbiA (DUF1768 family)